MSHYDLPGMGDFLPPEPVAQEPCAHCDEERDLPRGVDISIGGALVCYLCFRDYFDDHESPSGRDYMTDEIMEEVMANQPANEDAKVYRFPPS